MNEKPIAGELHELFTEKYGNDWPQEIRLTCRARALYWIVLMAERGLLARWKEHRAKTDAVRDERRKAARSADPYNAKRAYDAAVSSDVGRQHNRELMDLSEANLALKDLLHRIETLVISGSEPAECG
jgi:hypothetical protein